MDNTPPSWPLWQVHHACPSALTVWTALLDRAAERGSSTVPVSRAILSELTGISRLPTLSRALSVLEKAGWLRRQHVKLKTKYLTLMSVTLLRYEKRKTLSIQGLNKASPSVQSGYKERKSFLIDAPDDPLSYRERKTLPHYRERKTFPISSSSKKKINNNICKEHELLLDELTLTFRCSRSFAAKTLPELLERLVPSQILNLASYVRSHPDRFASPYSPRLLLSLSPDAVKQDAQQRAIVEGRRARLQAQEERRIAALDKEAQQHLAAAERRG